MQAEGENEVNNELANRMSLFYAEATPMLKTLSDATTKFVSEVSCRRPFSAPVLFCSLHGHSCPLACSQSGGLESCCDAIAFADAPCLLFSVSCSQLTMALVQSQSRGWSLSSFLRCSPLFHSWLCWILSSSSCLWKVNPAPATCRIRLPPSYLLLFLHLFFSLECFPWPGEMAAIKPDDLSL